MSDETWLSDYLLGESEPAEARDAERRLAADPELSADVDRLSDLVHQLRTLPDEAWPASRADEGAEPEVTDTALAAPGRTVKGSRRAMRRLALSGIATVALAAGVGIGAAIWSGGSSAGPRATGAAIELHALASTPARAVGIARPLSGDRLRLTVSDLPATAPGHYYEAWLMTSTTKLVALISFRVGSSGSTTLNVSLPAALRAYRYIDISLQATGGGPAHSDVSVLRGPTS
jgi:anti-sigma-K factor RskA